MTTRSLKRGGSTADTAIASITSAVMQTGGDTSPAPARSAKPLRGRKRFTADLATLSALPGSITGSGGWYVNSVKPGDEEASVEFVLAHPDEKKSPKIILFVSDSSQYPTDHTWIGYSDDAGDLESLVSRTIDQLPSVQETSLIETIEFVVKVISHDGNTVDYRQDDQDDESMFSVDDMDCFDYPETSKTSQRLLGHISRDFAEVKTAGYNPGILWTGENRFMLSISFPISDLFHHIAPHALLAWDRRFLDPETYLTLLISGFDGVYPILSQDGTLVPNFLRTGSNLRFRVGFTKQYKPSRNSATAAFREFTLQKVDLENGQDEEKEEEDASPPLDDAMQVDDSPLNYDLDPDPSEFRRMSLSASLESLLDQQLIRLVHFRRKFNLGWAGAEELFWQVETTQEDPTTINREKREVLESAETEEKKLSASSSLPSDPLDSGGDINIFHVSFAFLLRRLALSTRHCVVCHKKLDTEEALRPYVCPAALCVYQYYSLNLGPSIEHEIINNTGTVDLLVSLAYVAAVENTLNEPLPRGMGLRVQPPPGDSKVQVGDDGLCEFDELDLKNMRAAIAELLRSLPPIKKMKDHLQQQYSSGNLKVQLSDVDHNVLPAAWSVLRWCVASCTAHIQELTKPEDRLRNLGNYKQFRFLVGAPDKEKKFQSATPGGKHPTIFAFHGSPLRNWHSIIRHGLWFKEILNGRAKGDGVYFSQDASVSLGSYAARSSTALKNSTIRPTACCALAEIVNRRSEFVYGHRSCFVVDKTEWIMCRYLLVQTGANHMTCTPPPVGKNLQEPKVGQYLVQEHNMATSYASTHIDIPQPSYHLDQLVKACLAGRKGVVLESEDRAIFEGPQEALPSSETNSSTSANGAAKKLWVSDDKWIQRNAEALLPPPTESSLGASSALRKEFKALMGEQMSAIERDNLAGLGWYLPPQHNGDNLYQWLVELHSFDPELPIAKDMTTRGVSSVAMEIRFPPSYPYAPPFFRVIRPRFRSFMEGGGGHVTVGGSICIDLLTSDGWVPSYSVSAVLLQIKMAMSSMSSQDRYARLHNDWDRVYTPEEALNGYIRAAGIHNWKIKNEQEIRKLVTAR